MLTRLRPAALGGMLLFLPGSALALDIVVSGSVTDAVTAADLLGGAGSGLASTYESATTAVDVDVQSTTGPSDGWRLDLRRVDTAWHPSLRVWVRRTDDGTGPGTVTGGLTWVEVFPTETPFFEGTGDRAGVSVQVRISGVSLALPPSAYGVGLTYTLVDLP